MDHLVILLGAVFSATMAGASTDGCPQIALKSEHFAKVFNTTCYLFIDEELYWTEARASCWKLGGEMLSIHDDRTMNFIKSVLDNDLRWGKNGVWLGARYSGKRWRWTTGEILDYGYWASGEPSKILGLFSAEDCALMRRRDNWRWHDYLCSSLRFHYNYICQFPFNYHGQHSSHYGNQPQDNGNMAILTIILATGGIVLLILLLVFLIFRRRYHRKFSQEPVVNFDNRTYLEPLPPPPAPHHVVRPRPSSNMYLTPMEAAPLYEEVQKPNGLVAGAVDCKDFQGSPPLPPRYSDENLGACGGVALGELDGDMKAPLVCGSLASQESLDSAKDGRGLKAASIHNDYVDMNGSPVSLRSSQNGDGGSTSVASKPDGDVSDESKQPLVGDYSNLSTQRATCENVYERLP